MKLMFNIAEIIPVGDVEKNVCGAYIDVIEDISSCKYRPVGMVSTEFGNADFVGLKTRNAGKDKTFYIRKGNFEKLMRAYGSSTPQDLKGKQVIATNSITEKGDKELSGFLVSKGSLEVKLE